MLATIISELGVQVIVLFMYRLHQGQLLWARARARGSSVPD